MLTRWIVFLVALVVGDGARGQQDAAAPTLESLLVEALADPDWQVRRDAASLLGVFGTSEHVRHLQAVLDDERSEVWKRAWMAHLALRPEEIDGAIARITNGETWEDVGLLSRLLVPLVRAQHTPSLVAAFDRARSTHGQYALLVLLAHLGADMPAPVVAYARDCTTPQQISNASELLPLLPDAPEHRERVTGWLEHTSPLVRHRCAAWLQRHGEAGAAIAQHLIPDFVEVQVYEAERMLAEQALGAEWLRTSKAEVMAAAGKARVVLIAEKHGAKAIPDLVAACCVASMKGSERDQACGRACVCSEDRSNGPRGEMDGHREAGVAIATGFLLHAGSRGNAHPNRCQCALIRSPGRMLVGIGRWSRRRSSRPHAATVPSE